MSDLGDWFRSIPLITRYWFAGSIALPLVGKLGLISPVYLFLWPDAFLGRFQVGPALHLPACRAALARSAARRRRAEPAGGCSPARGGRWGAAPWRWAACRAAGAVPCSAPRPPLSRAEPLRPVSAVLVPSAQQRRTSAPVLKGAYSFRGRPGPGDPSPC